MIVHQVSSQVDVSQLRQFMQHALAELGQFEPGAFPLTEREIVRESRTCGYYFCLHGPRSVKLTAVCDLNQRAILFYGTDGQRSHQIPIHAMKQATARP